MKKVIIVGSGIGGLCSAVRLLNKGFKVTIFEKEKTIGGKVNIKGNNTFKFDFTASILMTPSIYTEIFNSVKRDYKDYFELINLDPIYTVNYYDKSRYNFYSDLRKMRNELEHIKKGLSGEYEKFLCKSLKKYLLVKNEFLNKPMVSIKELLNTNTIKSMIKINPLITSNLYISQMIHNKKFKEYLIFQSMYMGINPYTSSNVYTMIPAISHIYGLSYIKGGFYNYILALKKLIIELGGEIKTDTEVTEILTESKKVIGVKTKDTVHISDIVICNADYTYAVNNLFKKDIERKLYKNKNLDKKEYSCSVFMIYLGLNKKYTELKVHNIYISSEFRKSIEDPFNGMLPKNPSFYMYYPTAVDESLCEDSKSTLNIMVRVPNLFFNKIQWDYKNIEYFRNIIIGEVSKIKGLEDIESSIEYEDYLTPKDLEKDFYAFNGNAFGLSHKLSQSIYLRPHMKSKKIKGLYFAGSSIHPGNGVSIIIKGTKVLENIICKEYI